MPKNARKRAEDALRLKLESSGLARSGDIISAVRRLGTEGGKDTYIQVVVRRTDYQIIEQNLREVGYRIRSVFAETSDGVVHIVDYSEATDRPIWNWWTAAALSGSLLLSLLWIDLATDGRRISNKINETRAERTERTEEAQLLRQEIGENEASQSTYLSLVAQLEAATETLSILDSLTKSIPYAAWVSSLSIRKEAILLEALTTSEPIELIELIETLPIAASVELQRPIDTNPTDGISSISLQIERALK